MERGVIFGNQFASLLQGVMERLVPPPPKEEPAFLVRFRRHFGGDPHKLPILSETLSANDHPNLQVALDAYLAAPGRSSELLGLVGDGGGLGAPGLADLMRVGRFGSTVVEGPVQYIRLKAGRGVTLTCLQSGLYLVQDARAKLVVHVSGPSERSYEKRLRLEVMGPDRPTLEHFLAEIRALMQQQSVYRGQILSLSAGDHGLKIQFHQIAPVDRDQIILPEGLFARIERQTLGFTERRAELLRAGRHLKRGLLLHGPPGTGKTLAAMYLAGRMKDRTTLILAGRSLGLIEQSCALARLLQPSTIILEDVDLVAEERSRQSRGCNTVLFELLNEMDGMAADADVLFVLTTNRPDILEPALAARPGRIDQALEVPLPDAACRARLLELYGRGLSLQLDDPQQIILRTEGVSSAFMRELLRRAALFAARGEETITVEDRHMDEALHDLVVDGGALTKSLLGATRHTELTVTT